MAGKGTTSNTADRERKATEIRRAKKAAKANGTKKSEKKSFSIMDVVEDKKRHPLNVLNRVLQDEGISLNFSQRAHILARQYIGNEQSLLPAEKHEDRVFLILGVSFSGDFNVEISLGLEKIQNQWPSLKSWAFGAKLGDCFDMGFVPSHGTATPFLLSFDGTPSWMTIGRIE